MKKKIYVLLALMCVSYAAYSFVYRPDTWTTCLDESATYLDGAEAPVAGSCVVIGETYIEFEGIVDVSNCVLNDGPGANCTGNGLLRADANP